MGSSRSHIDDDWDAYVELCKKFGVKTKNFDNYEDHEKELMKKYGYERTYFGYQKINKTIR